MFKQAPPASSCHVSQFAEEWEAQWKPGNVDKQAHLRAWQHRADQVEFPKSTLHEMWLPTKEQFDEALRSSKG
eukprot:1815687-Pyramimonas_sp.AAC.1